MYLNIPYMEHLGKNSIGLKADSEWLSKRAVSLNKSLCVSDS